VGFERDQLDPEGRVLLNKSDLPPIEFDPSSELTIKRKTRLHLIGRRRFIASNGAQVEAADYNGFRVVFADGATKTFLKLLPGDDEHDAIDITAEITAGGFIVGERDDCSFSVGDKVRLTAAPRSEVRRSWYRPESKIIL
jgi:hypothetical protein